RVHPAVAKIRDQALVRSLGSRGTGDIVQIAEGIGLFEVCRWRQYSGLECQPHRGHLKCTGGAKVVPDGTLDGAQRGIVSDGAERLLEDRRLLLIPARA